MDRQKEQQFFKGRVFWYPATVFILLGLVTLGAALGVFSPGPFLPHATCYLRDERMILLHVSSDLVIGISYLVISMTLGYLVRKARKIIPFQWIFLSFGLFIITCGFTHLMEVVTVWRPFYWLAGWIKAITALASLGTAIGLIFIIPKVLKFLREAEKAEHHREELETANRELNAFAYSVSHDLRAPLRAVQGMSAALAEDYASILEPEAMEYLNRIVSASDRMDTLINDLLQYSRVSRAQIEMMPVPVTEAIADAQTQLSDEITRSGATIEAELPDLRVMAQKTILVQVLTNLLGNAIKFVPRDCKPAIRVTARTVDGRVRISVQDNGIGIAPEYQEKIFHIFERLHSASEYPGTGIGLAIVQRAISRMNGKLGVESKPGEGSTFWLELPAA